MHTFISHFGRLSILNIGAFGYVCLRASVDVRAHAFFLQQKRKKKQLFDSRSQAVCVWILQFVSLSVYLVNTLNVHSEVTFKQLMRLSSYNRDRTTTTTKRVEYFIWRAELWYACLNVCCCCCFCCRCCCCWCCFLFDLVEPRFDSMYTFFSLYASRWLFDRSNRLIKMFNFLCSIQSLQIDHAVQTELVLAKEKTVKTLVNVNISFETGKRCTSHKLNERPTVYFVGFFFVSYLLPSCHCVSLFTLLELERNSSSLNQFGHKFSRLNWSKLRNERRTRRALKNPSISQEFKLRHIFLSTGFGLSSFIHRAFDCSVLAVRTYIVCILFKFVSFGSVGQSIPW